MEVIIETQDPVLMTIEGGMKISDFDEYGLILPHEHFIQNLNKFYIGDVFESFRCNLKAKSIEKIELNNISYIRNNPYHNMNNLCLNNEEEMCTEIKQAFGDTKVLFVNQIQFE